MCHPPPPPPLFALGLGQSGYGSRALAYHIGVDYLAYDRRTAEYGKMGNCPNALDSNTCVAVTTWSVT